MAEKPLPRFSSEAEEQAFWSEHVATDYVSWSEARQVVLPNLKPLTRTISLRLREHMIEELKPLANKQDVPFQSLLKVYLAERLEQELGQARHKAA